MSKQELYKSEIELPREKEVSSVGIEQDGESDRMKILKKVFQVYLGKTETKEENEIFDYIEGHGEKLSKFLASSEGQVVLQEYLAKHPSDDDIENMKDMELIMVAYRDYFRLTQH